jgi:hypothetical protein
MILNMVSILGLGTQSFRRAYTLMSGSIIAGASQPESLLRNGTKSGLLVFVLKCRISTVANIDLESARHDPDDGEIFLSGGFLSSAPLSPRILSPIKFWIRS